MALSRITRRRWRLGLATLIGRRPGGYFIPYRYAAATPPPPTTYDGLRPLFDAARPAFATRLAALESHRTRFAQFNHAAPPLPRWQQDWFPRLDGAMAYAMIAMLRPARIIEIGSGHSTRFMMAAIADGDLNTEMLCIDPSPRADIAALPVRLLRRIVQTAGPEPFAALGPGDVLSIDSSHILMPGSDVDMILCDILPRLPRGVILHIHDIFLPFSYPHSWAWRGYNEQQGIAGVLAAGATEILWSSAYVVASMADLVGGSVAGELPLPDGAFESSLWLRYNESVA